MDRWMIAWLLTLLAALFCLPLLLFPDKHLVRDGVPSVMNAVTVSPHLRYCASLTFSIQSTTFPSRFSCMAMCVKAVVGVAPCQCFSPGEDQTTSPGRISSTGPPSL